jgi:putative restriction endonuclease
MDDRSVRVAAFEWLKEQTLLHDDVLPRTLLAKGFTLGGRRVPLLGPQGIFKPRVLPEIPLSITTTPNSPYDDAFGADGLLRYRYRGTDPEHRDNVGLARAMEEKTPLVYFHGILPGRYVAAWPVFIVHASPQTLRFTVAVDDAEYSSLGTLTSEGLGAAGSEADGGVPTSGPGYPPEAARSGLILPDDTEARREYVTRTVRHRIHQRAFRERVLAAYRSQCALCRFRHRELLEAAHIVPDEDPDGEPTVSNGLALCRLHHGAFDRYFLTVTPEFRVEVRPDLLDEEDGPTLQHLIKDLHGSLIVLPANASLRPNPSHLEDRYHRFREAAGLS